MVPMTLNRLRLYYVLLVLLDQWLWMAPALAAAVPLPVRVLAACLRLLLLVLAVAPPRFRLAQVRALRLISAYAFVTGAVFAFCARAGLAGEHTFWLSLTTPEACTDAYALSAFSVVVLALNAIILPRTRWL